LSKIGILNLQGYKKVLLIIIKMSKLPKQNTGRKLTIEDFLDDVNTNKNNKNHSYSNSNDIPKNQQVFGHNKRIKP
jgi:hypothetical protein